MAERRAVITKTLRIINDYVGEGDLIEDKDVPIYCREGTKGYYDPDDGFFRSDDGAEFYPPKHAVKYL